MFYRPDVAIEEVITATLKVISAATKVILATNNPPLKMISVTTKVILTTNAAFTAT